MPVLSYTDTRRAKGRLFVLLIYTLLTLGGVTMVWPFLVMVTGSASNSFDYNRRSALPRFLWSRPDRLMRVLCAHFPPFHRNSLAQMRAYFPTMPEDWTVWAQLGDEKAATDEWATAQLADLADATKHAQMETAARDYADFTREMNLRETVLAYDPKFVPEFLRRRYGDLEAFNKSWEVSADDFVKATDEEWRGEPIDQQGYVPEEDNRYLDLLTFRQEWLDHHYTSYLKGDSQAASYLRPASLRYVWESKFKELAGDWAAKAPNPLPFPVPDDAPGSLREAWLKFLQGYFPLRHVEITVTPERQKAFSVFLEKRFRTVEYMRRVLQEELPTWTSFPLTATVPEEERAKVWMDFVRTQIKPEQWIVRDTLPDLAFQRFALARHGDFAGLKAAYGEELQWPEQLRIPFRQAVLVTFEAHEWQATFDVVASNYSAVVEYLFRRGRAVGNTLILVVLTLLVTLTVNPLAGYALSRFRFRGSEQVILFCLVTMAFPAAVAAIPGFLLLRDLGMLNTFAALVLPGAANGMSIFLLKGFFDSLPRELYEAAALDGAPEWRVFLEISVPLVKPILAVSALNAFIMAYNGWEWAIIVCQSPKMWTVSVWTYQFFQMMGSQPATMAAFIVNSIPVLIVFLAAQKVILRGIVLPEMK